MGAGLVWGFFEGDTQRLPLKGLGGLTPCLLWKKGETTRQRVSTGDANTVFVKKDAIVVPALGFADDDQEAKPTLSRFAMGLSVSLV